MAKNVGTIEYDLNVETQQAVDAAKAATDSLGRTEKGMKDADRQASKLHTGMTKLAAGVKAANGRITGLTGSFGGLKSAIGGVVALLGAGTIIKMADEYTEAASRVRQVTADTEEYEKVQKRLLDTANKTYRPLQEAQEVYIRTSDAIKDLGYNTDQALDITDSFSFLLVTNAASADRASSAINGYSKAIQTGKIDSETWQTILSAMPSVVSDIATATGETEAKIRELGITGKLSLEALNEALLRSRDNNEQLAEAMDTTVGDAIVSLKNSMQVFVAQINESTGSTNGLVEAIELVSAKLQDPETIAAAETFATAVAAAFIKAVEAVETTVNMAGWAGESLAAALHGPALDDVVRMGDEIAKLQDKLAIYQAELDRARLLRINPFASDDDIIANIEQITAQIRIYEQAIEDTHDAEAKAALARAKKAAEDKKAAEEAAKKAEQEAKAKKKLVKAEADAAEETKRKAQAERDAKKAAEELAKAEAKNLQILLDLKEAVYQTTLTADELVERQVELAFNDYATPEQIAQAKALARELRALNEQQERRKKIGSDVDSFIKGDVSPLSGGLFDEGTARYEQEAQAEEERYRQQIERLIEAKELELVTNELYNLQLENLYQQHSDRMAEIDRARMTMQLTAMSSGFANMANDLKAFSQTFGAENKKMFAIIKASAIAGAIVDTYLSAQKAYTSLVGIPYVGPALAVSAATAAVMGGMARVAQIKAQNLSGARQHGGVVSSGQFYRVNEGGKPEIFQGADGNQYMMPTQNGEVVSHKDSRGKGSNLNIIINVQQNKERAGQVEESEDSQEQKVIDIFVADVTGDGQIAQTLQRKYGLQGIGY